MAKVMLKSRATILCKCPLTNGFEATHAETEEGQVIVVVRHTEFSGTWKELLGFDTEHREINGEMHEIPILARMGDTYIF